MTGLSTALAGIPFPSCLMNASGAWSGTHEELRELMASATGAVSDRLPSTLRVEEVLAEAFRPVCVGERALSHGTCLPPRAAQSKRVLPTADPRPR